MTNIATTTAPATPAPSSPVFALVTEQMLADVRSDQFSTVDEILSAVLDIQQHDGTKFDEAIAQLLVAGITARRRAITYAAANKSNKDRATRLTKYNAAVMANPAIALNPAANLSLQLAYEVISREQYDVLTAALNGASASIETHTVTTTEKHEKKA